MSGDVYISFYVTVLVCVWTTHTASAPSLEAAPESATCPETIPEPPVSPVSPAMAQRVIIAFYVMIALHAWGAHTSQLVVSFLSCLYS